MVRKFNQQARPMNKKSKHSRKEQKRRKQGTKVVVVYGVRKFPVVSSSCIFIKSLLSTYTVQEVTSHFF